MEVDIGGEGRNGGIPHYYGDIVRRLFLFTAIVALITLPFLVPRWPVHLPILTLFILVMGILAAATNPRQRWTAVANALASIAFLLVFESHAVLSIRNFGPGHIFFWAHQLFALIFLFALYFSAKTLRGFALRQKHGEEL